MSSDEVIHIFWGYVCEYAVRSHEKDLAKPGMQAPGLDRLKYKQ